MTLGCATVLRVLKRREVLHCIYTHYGYIHTGYIRLYSLQLIRTVYTTPVLPPAATVYPFQHALLYTCLMRQTAAIAVWMY